MSQEDEGTYRPRKKFNYEQFEKLCQIQCTKSEIAGFFDCSEDTIENRVREATGEKFSAVYKRLSAPGKISLRRQQFKLAEKEHAQMLIWLGKQYLGQSEKVTQDTTVDDKRVTINTTRDKKAEELF